MKYKSAANLLPVCLVTSDKVNPQHQDGYTSSTIWSRMGQ